MKNPTTLAVRAIAAAFAKQLLLPLIIGIGVVLLLLWAGLVLLATNVSAWWLLLALLLLPATLIASSIAAILWMLIKKLAPTMSPTQKKAANRFVAHTATYTELVGMSRFLLAFYIVRHAIQRKPGTYFDELLGQSKELRADFTIVRDEFSKQPRKTVPNLAEKK